VTLCIVVTDIPAYINSSCPNGTYLDPNSIKWSLNVTGYPFELSESRLALKVAFDTTESAQNITLPNADGINLLPWSPISAIASWCREVQIYSENSSSEGSVRVIRSILFNGQTTGDVDFDYPAANDSDGLPITRQLVIAYFSFISQFHPDSYYWDPSFGVLLTSEAHALNFGTPSIICCILIFISFHLLDVT